MAQGIRRYILHADMDAFYASVEQHDDLSLAGKPVAVGGPPESRGVVAAASYEARAYGVHSAMPMRTAQRLCPNLVRVSPRFPRYQEVSRQVMDIFHDVTPLVQPLSLDEAYLDISETLGQDTVEETARRLKDGVRREIGIVVTIGGGTSKTVAKVASQAAKPDGLLLVAPGAERAFLAPLEVDALWGVGPKTAAMLRSRGIRTIGDLAERDEDWLRRTLGKRGPELRDRAIGADDEDVTTDREIKSVSAEMTMATDVDRDDLMLEHMDWLVHRVHGRLQRQGLRGKTVSIKLRLADFTTFTRQRTLAVPTDDEDAILEAARDLLRRELRPGQKYRLVGMGVGNFQESFQMPLLPPV